MRNSVVLRRSSFSEIAVVILLLAVTASTFGFWLYLHGYVLYYGDAQAHLNISRSIIDSRTPGYEQIGTVWLPALHLICVPFVRNDWLWSSGLAGTIPVATCFVIAGTCFYLAAKQVFNCMISAGIVLACFALNPNVLYLATIPMTEVVFLAGLAIALLALVRHNLLLGILASWLMSLTRYDGWFLIPFLAIGFAFVTRGSRWKTLFGFGFAASIAPLCWVAHNWWETSNPLDFFNGPYSAMAIQGSRDYPGFHNWPVAIQYYAAAGRLCAGPLLIVLGFIGFLCGFLNKFAWPMIFLLLTPAFYVWSIHSSKNPIFVPELWPHGYYNSRYGIAIVAFAAFATGAIAASLPKDFRMFAVALPFVSVLPWVLHPSPESWITWKESQVNSNSRRAWTARSVAYIKPRYTNGERILTNFGDLTGIFCKADIPLQETLHEGNGPYWLAAATLPDSYRQARWVIVQSGTKLSQKIDQAKGFQLVQSIFSKDAPTVEIYQRSP